MKIMQIENGFVHWDATNDVPSLDWAASHYAPNIVFVEAPDYVFEGWTFEKNKEGDERFIKPTAPDGWWYDEQRGTFRLLNDTDDRTLEDRILELERKDTDIFSEPLSNIIQASIDQI